MDKTARFLRKEYLLSRLGELQKQLEGKDYQHNSLEAFSYRFYSRELNHMEDDLLDVLD